MPVVPVLNSDGKKIDTIEISDKLFVEKINKEVLYQAVLKYHASQRQGTASTKERGVVHGGGRKPWRQKGTGRARQGSIRSPLWHKGGVVFGPHPRDFSYSIPKKVKKVALRESLNAKYLSQDLHLVDDFKNALTKTKEFASILDVLKLRGKILALLDGSDLSIFRVSRNIRSFNIMRADDVNAFDILRNNKLLVTKSAFKKLLKRIS